jgi:isopentenyldiphosphate isomerase
MSEFLEVFDENNFSLRFTKIRRQVHEEGNWHRTAQVYVVNGYNELLCNLRSPLKDVFPLLWDVSFCGHLAPGESYLRCATRELGEELGIPVKAADLICVTTIKIDGKDEITNLIDREHARIFLYRSNLQDGAFHFQKEEILELRYFHITYVKENLKSGQPSIPFIPLQKQFLEIIEKIEDTLKSVT